MSVLQQYNANLRMTWLEDTLVPQVRLRRPERKYIPFNKFISVYGKAITPSCISISDKISRNISGRANCSTDINCNADIQRLLSTYSIDTTNNQLNKSVSCELSATSLTQSYNHSRFGIVVYLHSSAISQSHSEQPYINYVNLHGKAITQNFVGVKSYGVQVKEIIVTRSELLPAPAWMLETQIPKPRYKRVNFVQGKSVYEKALSKCISYASANLNIVNTTTARAISTSYNESNISITRDISSQSVTQSFIVSTGFYLAIIQELKASGLFQSMMYEYYYQNNPVTVQQLQSRSLSEFSSYNIPIYYVDVGSAGCSQSFFFQTVKAHKVLLTANSLTQDYFCINASVYAKSVPLSCIAIDASYNISAITRHFDIYSTSETQLYADSQETISRAENSQSISNSIYHNNISVTRVLSTEQYVQSYLSSHENIKIGLRSTAFLQSEGVAAEVLDRLLSMQTKTVSINKSQINRQINQTVQTVALSKSNSGEIISRIFNGVAESISIAQQAAGKINRLFVAGTISPSFYRGQLYFTKNLRSSFYSESYIYTPEAVIRSETAYTETNSHADVISDILFNKSGTAANITIGKSEETIDKPIAASAESQNPFHSNPNLARTVNSQQITYSNGQGNPFKKQKLFAQSNLQSELSVNGHVSRPLAVECQSEIYSDIKISREINLQTEVLTQTYNKSDEEIQRNISADGVSESKGDSDKSVLQTTYANVSSEAFAVVQNPFKKIRLSSNSVEQTYIGTSVIVTLYAKIHLSASGVSQSSAEVNNRIKRNVSTESLSESVSHLNGFDTLINLYTNAIVNTGISTSIEKSINLVADGVSQTYIGGTDTYFGNHYTEVQYVETSGIGVENLAPFNQPEAKQ